MYQKIQFFSRCSCWIILSPEKKQTHTNNKCMYEKFCSFLIHSLHFQFALHVVLSINILNTKNAQTQIVEKKKINNSLNLVFIFWLVFVACFNHVQNIFLLSSSNIYFSFFSIICSFLSFWSVLWSAHVTACNTSPKWTKDTREWVARHALFNCISSC